MDKHLGLFFFLIMIAVVFKEYKAAARDSDEQISLDKQNVDSCDVAAELQGLQSSFGHIESQMRDFSSLDYAFKMISMDTRLEQMAQNLKDMEDRLTRQFESRHLSFRQPPPPPPPGANYIEQINRALHEIEVRLTHRLDTWISSLEARMAPDPDKETPPTNDRIVMEKLDQIKESLDARLLNVETKLDQVERSHQCRNENQNNLVKGIETLKQEVLIDIENTVNVTTLQLNMLKKEINDFESKVLYSHKGLQDQNNIISFKLHNLQRYLEQNMDNIKSKLGPLENIQKTLAQTSNNIVYLQRYFEDDTRQKLVQPQQEANSHLTPERTDVPFEQTGTTMQEGDLLLSNDHETGSNQAPMTATICQCPEQVEGFYNNQTLLEITLLTGQVEYLIHQTNKYFQQIHKTLEDNCSSDIKK